MRELSKIPYRGVGHLVHSPSAILGDDRVDVGPRPLAAKLNVTVSCI